MRNPNAEPKFVATCVYCGIGFGTASPNAIYCSSDCTVAAQKASAPEHRCPACAMAFRSRDHKAKYCSATCRQIGRFREHRLQCIGCRDWFQVPLAQRLEDRPPICEMCIRAAVRGSARVHREYQRLNRAVERARVRVDHVRARQRTLSCRRCATEFTTMQPAQAFCSRRCYKAWHKGADSSQRNRPTFSKAKRARILERDGWRCYLCGSSIDRALLAPHPLSVSIDHVVAIARGGTHDDANLAAAHLGCNIEKSDNDVAWWAERALAVRS